MPKMSWALTRDMASTGISRCMVVVHRRPKMSEPMPQANPSWLMRTFLSAHTLALRPPRRVKSLGAFRDDMSTWPNG